tara:strand:+ start:12496 stop:13503 length:1008 start_codon:yes stop_codon:yes gene_type:complete
MTIFLATFFITLLIFLKNLNNITRKLNLYDIPKSSIKIHKKKVSLAGSLIFLNLIFLSIIFTDYVINYNLFKLTKNFYFFIVVAAIVFFIGFYDDKNNIKPYTKFFLLTFAVSLLVFVDETIKIKYLDFGFINYTVYIKNFDFIFTVFCFLLFLNAINLFDGINMQCIAYAISAIIFFIIIQGIDIFLLILVLYLIILLYLNFKNKIFLGDSGTLFLGFVISYYAIMIYEKNNLFNVEDIFLMMMIPGIDMFRLFLFRIFKNKNPFIGDNLHLHHLILNKFDQKISFFSIFFFNTAIFYLSYFFGIVFYAIIFNFIIYVVVVVYLLKFKTSKRVK